MNKINEQLVVAIMQSTPSGIRGNKVSPRAVWQGKYKAFDLYLEQVPTLQGFMCQTVVAYNGRIM